MIGLIFNENKHFVTQDFSPLFFIKIMFTFLKKTQIFFIYFFSSKLQKKKTTITKVVIFKKKVQIKKTECASDG